MLYLLHKTKILKDLAEQKAFKCTGSKPITCYHSVLQNPGDVRSLLKCQAEHQQQIQDQFRNLASLWCVCVPYLSDHSDRSCPLWGRENNFLPCLTYHRLCFHTADHNLVSNNPIIKKHLFKEIKCSLQQQNSLSKCSSAAGST